MIVRRVFLVTAEEAALKLQLTRSYLVRQEYETLKNRLATFKAKGASVRTIAAQQDRLNKFRAQHKVSSLTAKALSDNIDSLKLSRVQLISR